MTRRGTGRRETVSYLGSPTPVEEGVQTRNRDPLGFGTLTTETETGRRRRVELKDHRRLKGDPNRRSYPTTRPVDPGETR